MKKIILILFSVFAFSFYSYAQVSFSPATFTADDQVTLTVDVTGTPMAGQTEAYIWLWANPGGVGPTPSSLTNGDWGNSNPVQKMTAAGTNKWSFTFVGTTIFGLTPGQLNDFGFLVKAKDGNNAKTNDYKPFRFDPLIFTPNKLRIFPSKVGRDDVITMYFEKSLGTSTDEQRMTPTTVSITMYDETNATVGNVLTVPVRFAAENIWSASFIPTNSFVAPTGKKLSKFTYRFNGTVLSPTGGTQPVTSAEATVIFTEMK